MNYGISPLLMQNSYSKLILVLEMLSVDEFIFLQAPFRKIGDLAADKTNILFALQQSKILSKNHYKTSDFTHYISVFIKPHST